MSSPDQPVVSSLVVEEAKSSDSGAYRCASEAGESTITTVHIITGELIRKLFQSIWKVNACLPI